MIHLVAVARDAPMFLGVWFEVYSFVWFGLSLWHCLTYKGKWTAVKIFVVGFVYGLVLENGGPLELPALGFTGYFWEENYQLYFFEAFGHGVRLSAVPLATHVSWASVFYLAVLLWDRVCEAFPRVRSNWLLGGLVTSASGLLYDLPFDVVATRFHWWVWNENLQPFFFGVPLVNYISWFWAMFTFGCGWAWIHARDGQPGDGPPTTLDLKAGPELGPEPGPEAGPRRFPKLGEHQKRQTKRLALLLPVFWVVALGGFLLSITIGDLLGIIHVTG